MFVRNIQIKQLKLNKKNHNFCGFFTIFLFRSGLGNLMLEFSTDQAHKSILYHQKKHRKSDRFVLQCWSQGVIDFQIFCQNEKNKMTDSSPYVDLKAWLISNFFVKTTKKKWQIRPPTLISRRDFQIFCQNVKKKWQIHPSMSISRHDWFPRKLTNAWKKYF